MFGLVCRSTPRTFGGDVEKRDSACPGLSYNVAGMASALQAVRNAGANHVVILGAWRTRATPYPGPSGEVRPQLTAFFTSAPIFTSSAAVNSFSAKAVGHMAPSSRFAWCMKPNVAYLVLNLCALWKKQTILPSLAYAGIPYQVFGERAGALALMMAWSRSPMARSGPGIAAIFASTALSPSASSARGPGFCCLRVVSLFVFFISGLPRFLKTIQDESSDDIDIASAVFEKRGRCLLNAQRLEVRRRLFLPLRIRGES